MAWAEYTEEALSARKYELSRSTAKEYWNLAGFTEVVVWFRDVSIVEYAADGWSEAGAAAAVAALVEDDILNAESSRSGESGKYMVRWTEETYSAWELPE